MASSRTSSPLTPTVFHRNLIFAALAVFLLLGPVAYSETAAAAATKAVDSLSDGDRACLACHAHEGLKKDLPNGMSLALHIPDEAFAQSVHSMIGCTACHSDVNAKSHPQKTKNISDAREYAIAMSGACRGCHEETFKRHEGSIHAGLLRKGNKSAPICTDCHSPHSVSPRAVHRDACLTCHAGAPDTHRAWLTNAARHLQTITCAACHAPTAQPMVVLTLLDDATRMPLVEKDNSQKFEKLARMLDPDGNGLDAVQLRKLLAEYNPDGAESSVSLRGRIELRAGVDAHDLSDKSQALRDCTSCHRNRARPFQRVAVAVIGPGGKPVRHEARREVLTSIFSVDSVRGFYAVGGTRIELLDVLLLLAVLGGLSVPIGHQMLKKLVQLQLQARPGATATVRPQDDQGTPPAGNRPTRGDVPK